MIIIGNKPEGWPGWSVEEAGTGWDLCCWFAETPRGRGPWGGLMSFCVELPPFCVVNNFDSKVQHMTLLVWDPPGFVLDNIGLQKLGWEVSLDRNCPALRLHFALLFSSSTFSIFPFGGWRNSFPLFRNHLKQGTHLQRYILAYKTDSKYITIGLFKIKLIKEPI